MKTTATFLLGHMATPLAPILSVSPAFSTLALLVLVLVACDGTAAPTKTETGPTTTTTSPPNTTVTTDTAQSTSLVKAAEPPERLTPFADSVTPGKTIRLSPTHRVANVAAAGVLSVWRGAGARGRLVAELDPACESLRFTGEHRTVEGGGTWAKVVLADSAVQLVGAPEPSGVAWGWIDANYLEPITKFAPVGGECSVGSSDPHSGDPHSNYDRVVDVVVLPFAKCSQVVITLGQGDGTDSLGVTLPNVAIAHPYGDTIRLIVGKPANGSLTVPGPTSEVFAGGIQVFTTRSTDGGAWFDIHGATEAGVAYLPNQGQIVITVVAGGALPRRNASVAVADVVQGMDALTIRGYARPFEASLSVSVRDNTDTVVDVPASGDAIWKPRPGAFAVTTTGWVDAWGWYEFTLDLSVLGAGDYKVRLADDTGVEGIQAPVIEIPFTVP